MVKKMTRARTIKSLVCPICGCLCDDLEITVKNNEIIEMKNGCARNPNDEELLRKILSEVRLLKAQKAAED